MQQWFRAADDDNVQYIVQHRNLMHHSLDEFGNTALIRAAFSGSLHVVRELADVETGIQNQLGRSALMQCIFSSNSYVTAQHLSKELRLQDSSGQTALMLAASQNKADVAKILLKEQKMKDLKGRTALMIAASLNYVDIVKALVQTEATIQDNQGLTALHYAAYKNNFAVVALLAEIENGILSNKGETALSIAIQRNSVQSIQILSKYEAHIKVQGLDVHEYALEAGMTNQHILEMLNAIKEPSPCMENIQLEKQKSQNEEITNKINQLQQNQQNLKQQMNIDDYDMYQQKISIQQPTIKQYNIPQQAGKHESQQNINDDVYLTIQRIQTQLNQLQTQPLATKFIQEFDSLSVNLNTQISDLRQKITEVSLDMVKSKANIIQISQVSDRITLCEEKFKEFDLYQNLINNLKQQNQQNYTELINIKNEVVQIKEKLTELEQKQEEFVQRQDAAKLQSQNTLQSQIKFHDQQGADLSPVYQQIQELQHNMLRIIDLQQSKAQNPVQDTMLQLVHDVDNIKTQLTRMQIQNYNERLEALEQSFTQICQMLGGP